MKKILLAVFATAILLPARAGLFSPESVTGAAIGAGAGAIIGHNAGRHAGEGAAIGAGVGLLAGALVHEDRERHGYYGSPHYSHGGYYVSGYYGPSRHYGYYGHHGYYRHGYYGPRFSIGYYSEPSYYTVPTYVQPVVTAPAVEPTVVQQAPAPQPQQVTIINNYYGSGTPMSSANALFGR